MKDVLKGVTVKIVSLIIIIALVVGGGYLATSILWEIYLVGPDMKRLVVLR